MKSRIFLVMSTDIVGYPPVISLIRLLIDLDYEPYVIGRYSDKNMRYEFERRGAHFYDTTFYSSKLPLLKRLVSILSFRFETNKILRQLNVKDEEFVWFLNADTISVLYKLVPKYNSILHFYEFVKPVLSFGFWLVSPSYKMGDTMRKAQKVIHCEYNRAHITKALYNLKTLPYVFPNKPYFTDDDISTVPTDIKKLITEVKGKINGKKVILYQGLFNSSERRLEEFCEALQQMPEEYVLIAMGAGSNYYDNLKKKYESDKIQFIPFVSPPYHLLITQLAHIGVLTYFARNNEYAGALNPLYCAPNKIFEYAKFGIPMLSNDIPGLNCIFDKYHCGLCLGYPISPESIKNAIFYIFEHYDDMSSKSRLYYDSVDLKKIVENILEQNEQKY